MPDEAADRKPPVNAATDLEAVMDAAVDAIIVIEADGSIVAFSRAAETMFGYAAAEMIGRPVHSLMPEPFRSGHQAYIDRYVETGEARIIGAGRQVQALRRDGSEFPAWLSVGESMTVSARHFVGIIRDLTEQQKGELERHSLEVRLAHVSRFSLLGEMAAGIAHEINQPLAAITNYSQAAKKFLERDDPDTEQLRKACAGISEQVERAGEVIQNLRQFVRKREIRKERLHLDELIEGVMVLVIADATHEGVFIETEFGEGLPAIAGNAVQLQQVVVNLTRNAVDAMRGAVGRPKTLRIETVRSGPGHVQIRVSDHGPGISSRLADAIFHPFFTTKKEGLGVGLAISRTIVEAHGGKLGFEDRPAGGTTFTVTLPLLRENA